MLLRLPEGCQVWANTSDSPDPRVPEALHLAVRARRNLRAPRCGRGQEIGLRISQAHQRYGGSGEFAPSDSPLDYVYLGQLVDLDSKEWPLFRAVFGEKRFLADKIKDIARVRNDEAHFRNIPQVEKMRAYVACAGILTKLRETPQ